MQKTLLQKMKGRSKPSTLLAIIVSLLVIMLMVVQLPLLLGGRLDCKGRPCGSSPAVLFRSSKTILRAAATQLCVGIPLRQEDAVDDSFLKGLRSNFAGDLGVEKVVIFVTTRGESRVNEAIRISRELVVNDPTIQTKAVHEALQPFALADNATLGTMINHMLMQFTRSRGDEASCTQILLLDPSRIPATSSFLRTMLRDIRTSDAAAATCTTHYNAPTISSATSELGSVLDRGFYLTMDPRAHLPAVTRIDYGKRESAGSHTNQASVSSVQLVSPHCMLINLKTIRKRAGAGGAVMLQIPDAVAGEATVVDSLLGALEQLARWNALLSSELRKITPREVMKSLPEPQMAAVRRAFSVSHDAQRALEAVAGSAIDASVVNAPTNGLIESCQGLAHTQPIESLDCVAGMVKAHMQSALRLTTELPLSSPPEEQVGWSLSLAIYDLLGSGTSADHHTLVSSAAACVLSHNNVPIALRSHMKAVPSAGRQTLLGSASFPLSPGGVFWTAHSDVMQLYSELSMLR
jgi:hypothetical protein